MRVRRWSGGRQACASARPVHDHPTWVAGLRDSVCRACARRRTRYHHYATDVGKYSDEDANRLIEGVLMSHKPRIAVILDENTSVDASRYEASKGLFSAIRDAGGLPFGIPYLAEIVGVVVDEFDALLCGGGRFAYPDDWYLEGKVSKAP